MKTVLSASDHGLGLNQRAWTVRFGEESLTGLEPLDRQSLDVHCHEMWNSAK